MITGIVNQAIVGKDNALRVTIALHIINIAFLPVAAVFLRQLAFVIAVAVAADGFTRCNLVECAFCLPAQLFGLVFRDIIVRQALIFVDVGSNVLLVGVGSAFADFDFAVVVWVVCLSLVLGLLLPQPTIMLTLSSIARKNAKSFCIRMLLS